MRSGQGLDRDDGNSDEVKDDDGSDRFKGLCLHVCLLRSAAVNSAKIYDCFSVMQHTTLLITYSQ